MAAIERLKAADLRDIQPSAEERAQKRQHWPKHQRASETPHTHNYVIGGYENALVMDAMPSKLRGMMSVFACGLLCLGLFAGYADIRAFEWLWDLFFDAEHYWMIPFQLVLNLITTAIFLICIIASIRAFRVDLCAPREAPLIFNRKTRKVYRYGPDIPSFEDMAGPDGKFCWRGVGRYILKTFLPWHNRMLLIEYDWDCLEAEFYRVTAMAGKVLRTDDHLDLYVLEAPGSDKVLNSFPLIPSIETGEVVARDVWEHVRRFMEEGGPLLNQHDQPGSPPPRTFFQALNRPLGLGWVFFLSGAVWTWEVVYANVRYFLAGPRDPHTYELSKRIDAVSLHGNFPFLLQYGAAAISYFAMTWIVFHIIGMYLAAKAPLPDDLIEDMGQPVDLSDLASQLIREQYGDRPE